MTPPPPRRKTPQKAFALVTAIVLMAFIVLLLVALAGLLRVETMSSSVSQQVIEAKQNALFGLNMALGELQKQMGPDQRVSGPSNLGSIIDGSEARLPHLTGVWRQGSGNGSLALATHNPQLTAWLVSGNERINPGDSGYVTPANLFAGSRPDTDQDVVWLVGANSVTVPSTIDASTPDPRVWARTTPVGSRGRYAWWVGDEGVKASLSLTDPFVGSNSPNRLRSMPNFRVDQMTGLSALSSLVNTPIQDRITSPRDLPLASPGIDANSLKSSFHHLTGLATMLLTDVSHGGLKQDMTWLVGQSSSTQFGDAMNQAFLDISSSTTWFSNSAQDGNQIIQPGITLSSAFPAAAAPVAGPTWEQLRSFCRSGQDIPGLNSSSITPTTQTALRHGVFPLLIHLKLGMGISRETSGADSRMFLHMRPLFVVANPYTVDFAPGNYHAILRLGTNILIKDGNTTVQSISGPTLVQGIKFRLSSSGIPAGEAHVFTLDRSASGPSWDGNTESFLWGQYETYTLTDDFDSDASIRYPLNNGNVVANAVAGNMTIHTGGAGDVAGMLLTSNPSGPETIYHYLRGGSTSGNNTFTSTGLGSNSGIKHGGGFLQRFLDLQSRGTSTGTSASILADTNLRSLFTYTALFVSTDARIPIVHSGGCQNSFSSFFDPLNQASFLNMDNTKRTTWLMNGRSNGSPAVNEVVLFDVPRSPEELLSLGQLEHFNAAGFVPVSNSDGLSFSYSPSGAITLTFNSANSNNPKLTDIQTNCYVPTSVIGQSKASQFVKREEVASQPSGITDKRIFRDVSFLLNEVLFDRFFFSSVPQSGSFNPDADSLPNSRYRPIDRGLSAGELRSSGTSAAERLWVRGGFNVNSTSVEAWTAFLSGTLGMTEGSGPADALEAPFPRSLNQPGGVANSEDGISTNAWSGSRRLSASQIRALAEAVVAQVKLRGPFLSLADFVNRRLIESSSDTGKIGIAGPLESAINPPVPDPPTFHSVFAAGTMAGRQAIPAPPSLSTTQDRDHVARHYLQGFPGWLTQADVLKPIAPYLSARSDTFVIRAYGEVRNNRAGNTNIEAKAWCEATVQRIPDFIDSSQEPSTSRFGTPGLNSTNQNFGRRFVVVGFRWLKPEEI